MMGDHGDMKTLIGTGFGLEYTIMELWFAVGFECVLGWESERKVVD